MAIFDAPRGNAISVSSPLESCAGFTAVSLEKIAAAISDKPIKITVALHRRLLGVFPVFHRPVDRISIAGLIFRD